MFHKIIYDWIFFYKFQHNGNVLESHQFHTRIIQLKPELRRQITT